MGIIVFSFKFFSFFSFFSLDRCSIPSREVFILCSYLDIILLFSSYVYILCLAHFHFVLSLGAVIAIFSGIIFNGEKILASKSLLPSPSSTLSLYHLVLTLVGILL